MTLREVFDYHAKLQRLAELRAQDGRVSPHSRVKWEHEAQLHRRMAEAIGFAMRQSRVKPSLLDVPR